MGHLLFKLEIVLICAVVTISVVLHMTKGQNSQKFFSPISSPYIM